MTCSKIDAMIPNCIPLAIMFSCTAAKHNEGEDDEYCTFSLELEYKGLTLWFEPEYPEIISKIDIHTRFGQINTKPSNGKFALKWSSSSIKIVCGKYGDGQGGSITVKIPATPESMKSLRSALQVWKDIL